MMRIRQTQSSDLDALHALAKESSTGITTLPKDRTLFEKRLNFALQSFDTLTNPGYFLFVLEIPKTGEIVGCAAIKTETGSHAPFYSYRLLNETRISPSLNIKQDHTLLILTQDNQHKSELCTLFLSKNFRKNGNALLLSKSRFLWMANHPKCFQTKVIAEIRGLSHEKNTPFWHAIGEKFFKMPFQEADEESLRGSQFIQDLMPSIPLYVSLLPDDAKAAIQKPHPEAIGAMNILSHEGFELNDTIDIFDGGPTLEARFDHIKSIKKSNVLPLLELKDVLSTTTRYLLSTVNGPFFATLTTAMITAEGLILTKNIAKLLGLQPGMLVRALPISLEGKKI